jgi:fatty acid CoA ligase FadD9
MATYSAGAGITLTALNQELSRKAEARLQALLDADPQFASLVPEDSLMAPCGGMVSSGASPELGTSIQVVHALMKTYAERVAFYQCPPDGEWDTHGRAITYSEVWTRVTRLATALQSGGHLKRGGFVGIAGFASVDWAVADVASLYIGAVVVPIPLNVPPSDMVHILTEAEVSVVCCSEAELKVLAPVLHECPTVATLMVMDTPHEAIGEIQLPQLPTSVAAVATMAELEAKGAGMKVRAFSPSVHTMFSTQP